MQFRAGQKVAKMGTHESGVQVPAPLFNIIGRASPPSALNGIACLPQIVVE
jgi:hypothetical protein